MSRREVNGDNMNTIKALPSVLTLWVHPTRFRWFSRPTRPASTPCLVGPTSSARATPSQLLRLPSTQPRPRSYHTVQKIVLRKNSNTRSLLQKFRTNHQTTHTLVFRNKQ
jgi:hypothetical protein